MIPSAKDSQKIKCAKDKNDQFGLPTAIDGLKGSFQPMQFHLIKKQQVDGFTQETAETVSAHGVRVPFGPQQLKMKPAGMRHWRWHTIFAETSADVKIDDRVVLNSVTYRVMQRSDWTEYGYIAFDVIEDYENLSRSV